MSRYLTSYTIFPPFVFNSLHHSVVKYIMYTESVREANSTSNLTRTAEVLSQSSLLVVQVFLGLISVSALLGNGLVCVAVTRKREILRSTYNIFLFSLAVTDMLTGKLKTAECYESSFLFLS